MIDYDEVKRRCERRFQVIDNLPKAVREVIHEYGWEPVKLLMDLGVKRPKHMVHIIKACRGERT